MPGIRGSIALGLTMIVATLVGCASQSERGLSSSDGDEARLAEYLRTTSEALASEFGIQHPPEVRLERVIHLNEWAEIQIQCLNEAGVSATVTPDGAGISFPATADEGLSESINLARYTCEVKYPVDPRFYDPLTERQLEHLYNYRTVDLLKCLEEHGQVIKNIPSLMTFIESDGAWSPCEQVVSDADGEIERACPQRPEDLFD